MTKIKKWDCDVYYLKQYKVLNIEAQSEAMAKEKARYEFLTAHKDVNSYCSIEEVEAWEKD